MFEVLFGLVWITFITGAIVVSIFGQSASSSGIPIFVYPIFALFEFIGIFIFTRGLKKIIKDRKTQKYGTHCYGVISDIVQTGASVNGNPEYKAVIDFVNPNTQQLDTLEEIVGFNYNKYHINSYVLCKYYEGDVNIIDQISDAQVPEEYKNMLSACMTNEE